MCRGSDEFVAQPGVDAPQIRLTGELDVATADSMFAPAHRLVAEGHRHFILNCAALDFCDSQGLMAMVRLLRAVQPDGAVMLAEPSDTLVKLLTVTGLADEFLIRLSN